MLGVIEREVVRKLYFLTRPLNNFSRGRAFTSTEAAGTDLSGSWDETILRRNDLGAFQEASKVHTLIDNHQSKGSHVVDVDGNVLLDLCSTETLPLGHNNDAFIKDLTRSSNLDANIINSSLDASSRVDGDFADRASDALDSVAPSGLPNVTFTGPNNAVEQAIFAAMRERSQDGQALSALGFEGSHHGNSLALAQFAHPGMSLQMGWPSVKYPESSA
jgi:4-aminobutyrate aminotransferase-like enzyme